MLPAPWAAFASLPGRSPQACRVHALQDTAQGVTLSRAKGHVQASRSAESFAAMVATHRWTPEAVQVAGRDTPVATPRPVGVGKAALPAPAGDGVGADVELVGELGRGVLGADLAQAVAAALVDLGATLQEAAGAVHLAADAGHGRGHDAGDHGLGEAKAPGDVLVTIAGETQPDDHDLDRLEGGEDLADGVTEAEAVEGRMGDIHGGGGGAVWVMALAPSTVRKSESEHMF